MTKFSRYTLDDSIFSRQSSVFTGSFTTLLAMVVMPLMAFMGVRISWDMRERKSVLARLTASALDFIIKEGMIFTSSFSSLRCSIVHSKPS